MYVRMQVYSSRSHYHTPQDLKLHNSGSYQLISRPGRLFISGTISLPCTCRGRVHMSFGKLLIKILSYSGVLGVTNCDVAICSHTRYC